MNSYLLLRSNKETGPFSLEEIVEFGLKPYDLVWVKGKSAAWRYPSEVEELKPYAPEVEEQPFDRFYKKFEPSPELIVTAPIHLPAKKSYIEEKKQLPAFEAYQPKPSLVEVEKVEEINIGKKSVFVTMPGQFQKRTASVKTIVQQPKITQPNKIVTPIPDYTLETETSVKVEIKEEPKVKYSQPLDDIKEMYVRTLKDRKSKIARKAIWLRYVKVAAVVIVLIGIGVLAGMAFKSPDNKLEVETKGAAKISASPILINDSLQKPPPPLSDEIQENIQVDNKLVDVSDDKSSLTENNKIESSLPVASREVLQSEKKIIPKATMIEKTVKSDESAVAFTPSERNASTGERSRSVRNNQSPVASDNSNEEPPLVSENNNLKQLVSVTSNDYKRVAFGGIRDLRLTVKNRSNELLENVVVELQYLKPSEEILRTETIVFRGVQPNESSTIRVADTNRGIKVVFKIISVAKDKAGIAVNKLDEKK